MLLRTITLLLLTAWAVSAQDRGFVLGPEYEASVQPSTQELAAQQLRNKAAALGGHNFRRVDGRIYNLWQAGQFVGGTVQSVESDVVILSDGTGRSRAIRNFHSEPIANSYILTFALRNGVYNWNGAQVELYDCGIILPPDEELQQEEALRQKLAADIRAKADAVAAKQAEVRAKNFQVQSNAVLRLQTLATNGQTWAQCSLGLHYLNGEGCDTNRSFAVLWLTKAASNGDFEASNTLARLKINQ